MLTWTVQRADMVPVNGVGAVFGLMLRTSAWLTVSRSRRQGKYYWTAWIETGNG